MRTNKIIFILAIFMAGIWLSGCKSKEVLPGGISGTVTDAETSQPLQSATVKLNPLNDSTITGSDGKFTFTSLESGSYILEAVKNGYGKKSSSVDVSNGNTTVVNFSLSGAPLAGISDEYLDFGLELTSKTFIISNIGKSTLKYSVNSDSWITVSPSSGEITDTPETLVVTINRSGLPGYIQQGVINISSIGTDNSDKTVGVYVNGVMGSGDKYYQIIKIGTQTWMQENLNDGLQIGAGTEQTDFQVIKKYCYNNADENCNVYGGLYQWPEMMRGSASDTASTGTTRGICPVGWHIPTVKEWTALMDYLDATVAGNKMKEAGTAHWLSPSLGTNESGFTALPGGIWEGGFSLMNSHERFWTATGNPSTGLKYGLQLEYNSGKGFFYEYAGTQAMAVRCLKDPSK
jgi:uncharacterized protein (TIGR02145 family)